MDWKLAIEEERAVLKRIVALLFSLANLAESASRRSRIVRGFVIWVLRRAEVVAWDIVIGEDVPPALMPVSPAGDGPAEALRLAQIFRDLACELDRQAILVFAIHDSPHSEASEAGSARLGAFRTLDTNAFLTALRQVFVTIARPVAWATGPPETC